jgi:hypothetical protein
VLAFQNDVLILFEGFPNNILFQGKIASLPAYNIDSENNNGRRKLHLRPFPFPGLKNI